MFDMGPDFGDLAVHQIPLRLGDPERLCFRPVFLLKGKWNTVHLFSWQPFPYFLPRFSFAVKDSRLHRARREGVVLRTYRHCRYEKTKRGEKQGNGQKDSSILCGKMKGSTISELRAKIQKRFRKSVPRRKFHKTEGPKTSFLFIIGEIYQKEQEFF